MATSASNRNDLGLLVVPTCADPQWVQTHGTPTLDIVAVHGLNGGRWSTWSKDGVMWLQDLLPAKFRAARIMTFGYNADLVKNFSTFRIRDHARKLLSLLRDERDGLDATSRPIVFICHSLGGIVVKQALRFATNEASYGELATATCGVVFLATPHRGSDLAYWGSLLARLAKASFLNPASDLIDGLKNNSDDLMAVSEDFRSIANRYKIVSFYEEDKHPVLRKEVVGKHSAVMEIPDEEAIPLGGNHMEVCKFFGEKDPRFGEVWKAIRRVAAAGVRRE